MITNAGNKLHERMLALIQQDLARLGIQLNVVVLDFPSLIERISRSYNYESVLMAWTNIDLDPSAQMNVWTQLCGIITNGIPARKTPDFAWEAEIDKLMQAQNSFSQDPETAQSLFRPGAADFGGPGAHAVSGKSGMPCRPSRPM